MRWILPLLIFVGGVAYLVWDREPMGPSMLETPAVTRAIKEFRGQPFYELNMEGEIPLTTSCSLLNDLLIEKLNTRP